MEQESNFIKGLRLASLNLVTGADTGLATGLEKTVDVLTELKIPYVIVGGLAVSVYAKPRMTEDIDFLIPDGKVVELKAFSKKHGYTLAPIEFGYTIDFGTSGIDLLEATEEFEKQALHQPNTLTVLGRKVSVIAPEYLVLMKLRALRKKDESDIVELLKKFNKDKIKQTKKLVKEFFPHLTEDFDQMILIATYELGNLAK